MICRRVLDIAGRQVVSYRTINLNIIIIAAKLTTIFGEVASLASIPGGNPERGKMEIMIPNLHVAKFLLVRAEEEISTSAHFESITLLRKMRSRT